MTKALQNSTDSNNYNNCKKKTTEMANALFSFTVFSTIEYTLFHTDVCKN